MTESSDQNKPAEADAAAGAAKVPAASRGGRSRRRRAEPDHASGAGQEAECRPTETVREPGDDSPHDQDSVQKRASFEPRPTITVPLADGSVARYTDGFNNRGIGIRIDHPDEKFRPSQYVNEPLKEEHPGRNRMTWRNKQWHKEVSNNPIAERLDAEDRFAEMVKRRKEELEKESDGKVPF